MKVVLGGDVVVGAVPNFDFPFGGSVVEGQKVLANIAKLDFDTLVPGHSAPPPAKTTMTKAEFMAYKMKIDTLVARARELVKSGTPKDQLIAKIKTDDLGWNININNWTIPARIDPFYQELTTGKPATTPKTE